MVLINLKDSIPNLELQRLGFNPITCDDTCAEIKYFEEYYIIKEQGQIIKGFRQEFVKDPYIDLLPLPQIRLLSIPASIESSDLELILGSSDLPVITRTFEKEKMRGFEYLLNKRGEPTKLLKINIDLSKWQPRPLGPYVRLMLADDLDKVQELFRLQYSLRYRAVPLLWKDCPSACFVYEQNSEILGATFNKLEENSLYMRQIFVKEGFRDRGIGHQLYTARLSLATKMGLKKAYGHIRNESLLFHRHYTQARGELVEYYVIKR